MLGRLGREFFVAFDGGVVFGVEQVFEVPTADEEFVGPGGIGVWTRQRANRIKAAGSRRFIDSLRCQAWVPRI